MSQQRLVDRIREYFELVDQETPNQPWSPARPLASSGNFDAYLYGEELLEPSGRLATTHLPTVSAPSSPMISSPPRTPGAEDGRYARGFLGRPSSGPSSPILELWDPMHSSLSDGEFIRDRLRRPEATPEPYFEIQRGKARAASSKGGPAGLDIEKVSLLPVIQSTIAERRATGATPIDRSRLLLVKPPKTPSRLAQLLEQVNSHGSLSDGEFLEGNHRLFHQPSPTTLEEPSRSGLRGGSASSGDTPELGPSPEDSPRIAALTDEQTGDAAEFYLVRTTTGSHDLVSGQLPSEGHIRRIPILLDDAARRASAHMASNALTSDSEGHAADDELDSDTDDELLIKHSGKGKQRASSCSLRALSQNDQDIRHSILQKEAEIRDLKWELVELRARLSPLALDNQPRTNITIESEVVDRKSAAHSVDLSEAITPYAGILDYANPS